MIMSAEETEVLSLSKTYSIKIKFSHTVADGKALISATEGIDRTGLLVWRGARVFYEWSVKDNSNDFNEFNGAVLKKMDIIELGGGLGFGSMIVGGLIDFLSQKHISTLSPSSTSVLCTDFFLPALELADEQIQLNTTSSAENPQVQRQNLSPIVSTAQLDWCWALSEKGEDQQKLDAFCARYILSNRSSNQQLLLLALDCVYPDTRNDVLCGLFVTIAKLFTVKMMHQKSSLIETEEEEEESSSKTEIPFLIMTFVERDVGLTLRRLITAASICGLKVDPLEQPVLADKNHEIKLFGEPSMSNKRENSFSFVRDCLLVPRQYFAGDENEVWSRMQNSFIFQDSEKHENENKTWFSCAGATWILKIQLHHQLNSGSNTFPLRTHDGCIALAEKCNYVIESLTKEVNEFLQAQKEGEAAADEDKLPTLISAGLLDPTHFNSKWWITFGYLCFKDSYLAARSLKFHVDPENQEMLLPSALNLSLDKSLVAKVLQERFDLVDEKFMQMEIEDLF